MEEVHYPAEFGALAVQLQHAADGVVKAAHDADVAHKAIAKDKDRLDLEQVGRQHADCAHTAAAAGVFKRFHHKIDADVRAQRFERGDDGRRIRAPGGQAGSRPHQIGQTKRDLERIPHRDRRLKALLPQQAARRTGRVVGAGHPACERDAENLAGVLRAAERPHVLVQVGVRGGGKLLAAGQFFIQRGRVDLHIVEILLPGAERDHIRDDRDPQLPRLVRGQVADRIGEHPDHGIHLRPLHNIYSLLYLLEAVKNVPCPGIRAQKTMVRINKDSTPARQSQCNVPQKGAKWVMVR